MSVRVWGSPLLHRWAATNPDDRRIAWTFCGIRFVWGQLPAAILTTKSCTGCWEDVRRG